MKQNLHVQDDPKDPTLQNKNSSIQLNQDNKIVNDDPLSETMSDEQIERSLSVKKTDEENAEEKADAEETAAAEEEDFNEPTMSEGPTVD